MELGTAIWIGVVAFASTNIDDLIILCCYFVDRRTTARNVVLGQYLGMIVLIVGSLILATLALALPRGWLPWLGLAPLAIGFYRLFQPEDTSLRPRDGKGDQQIKAGAILSVAAVTIASGGDNIAIYTPLFATTSPAQWIILSAVFLGLVGLWCAVAYALVTHRPLRDVVQAFGRWLAPVVLIGLGIKILWPLFGR